MIYLDNAATSWPKPEGVIEAMEEYLREYGASPGARRPPAIHCCRAGSDGDQGAFSPTDQRRRPGPHCFHRQWHRRPQPGYQRLPLPGDHVITSSMEHNSVVRPLKALEEWGIETSKVSCNKDGTFPLAELEGVIKENTRLIVLTHASNVTGTIMPVAEVGRIARRHNLLFLVDAAQSLGTLPVDVQEMGIDLLAFPGHKGLFGPSGTGGLYIRPGVELRPLCEGGTGSQSASLRQPETLPDRYESGTLNAVGIAGLGAGVKFLLTEGIGRVREHEQKLVDRLLQGLNTIPGIVVYGVKDSAHQAPVVSFTVRNYDPAEVAVILDQVFDIACRSGLHCAPDAHQTLGTLPQGGTVRLSPGYFNTEEDIDLALTAIEEIAAKA